MAAGTRQKSQRGRGAAEAFSLHYKAVSTGKEPVSQGRAAAFEAAYPHAERRDGDIAVMKYMKKKTKLERAVTRRRNGGPPPWVSSDSETSGTGLTSDEDNGSQLSPPSRTPPSPVQTERYAPAHPEVEDRYKVVEWATLREEVLKAWALNLDEFTKAWFTEDDVVVKAPWMKLVMSAPETRPFIRAVMRESHSTGLFVRHRIFAKYYVPLVSEKTGADFGLEFDGEDEQ